MKKLLSVLTLGVFAVAATARAATSDLEQSVRRGEYVARASNCIACHTYHKGPYAGGVPFGWRLDDQQLADVVTFIRGSWGNHAPAVSAEDVRKVREDKSLFPDPRVFGNSNVDKLMETQP